MSATAVNTPFQVDVSSDRLTATIRLRDEADGTHATTGDVIVALETAKVALNEAVRGRIDAYLARIHAGEDVHEPAVIAEGRAPCKGKDGYFKWYEPIAPKEEAINEDADASKLSHYDVSKFIVVNSGDVIGHITPPEPCAAGLDVHGHDMPVRNKPREFRVGANVTLAEDAVTIVASEPGRVQRSPWEIAVVCILEISENVDFSVGHIDSPTPVCVRGNIRDLFKVRTEKWLTVGGAIEAADVEADDYIQVKGGILNRDKGFVKTGGTLEAKFCTEATVDAKGDVTIGKEVLNSRINTQARLIIPNGAVIGGQVYARVGVEARTLGSDAGIPTSIGVGVPEEIIRNAKTVEFNNLRRRKSIERIREMISPLMPQIKQLEPPQQERATELLGQADAIEAEIQRAEEAIKAGLANIFVPSDGDNESEDIGPYVLFQSKVCQGVTVRIDDKVTFFVKELKGPVRLCKRRIEKHTVLAAVNQITGSVTELNSRKVESKKPQPSKRKKK